MTVIRQNDISLYYRTNQISIHKILFWCQGKSNSKQMFEWLIVDQEMDDTLSC